MQGGRPLGPGSGRRHRWGGCARPKAAAPSKGRLKPGLNAYSFARKLQDGLKVRGNGVTLFDLVNFCAQYDIGGLDVTGYFFPGYPKVPSPDFLNDLKRRAFRAGVALCGTGVRNNFTIPDKAKRAADIQHIKEWTEVASRLGAPVLRVFADTQLKGATWETLAPASTREQVELWIADDLRTCAEYGKRLGVVIGVQNHGDFLKTGDDVMHLLQRVGSEWCGPIVDTGYFRSKDPYADIARVAPHALTWQIKETPFGVESDVRMDLKKLVRIIYNSGYRGFLPIHTVPLNGADYDPFVAVPKMLKELRQVIEKTEAG